MDRKQQGDVGVAMAIAYYTKRGWAVSVPLGDNQRYDLLVDDGIAIHRVQVKSTGYKKSAAASFSVHLKTCGGNTTWTGVSKYITSEEVDIVFVYCSDGTLYEIPSKTVEGKGNLVLSSTYAEYRVEL